MIMMMMTSPSIVMFLSAIQASLFLAAIPRLEAFTTSIPTSTNIQLPPSKKGKTQVQGRTHHVSLNSNSSDNNDPIANLREKFPFLVAVGQQNNEEQLVKGEEGEAEVDEDAYVKQQRQTKEVLSSLGITMKEPEVAYVEKDNFSDIATASIPVSSCTISHFTPFLCHCIDS